MVYWKRDYMLYYSSFTCRIFMSETSKKNTQINFWLEIIVVTYIVIYWVEKSHYCIEHNFTYLESFMVGTIPLFLPGNSTTFRGNTLSSLSTSLSFWMISLVWFFFSLKIRMFHFQEFFLKYINKILKPKNDYVPPSFWTSNWHERFHRSISRFVVIDKWESRRNMKII